VTSQYTHCDNSEHWHSFDITRYSLCEGVHDSHVTSHDTVTLVITCTWHPCDITWYTHCSDGVVDSDTGLPGIVQVHLQGGVWERDTARQLMKSQLHPDYVAHTGLNLLLMQTSFNRNPSRIRHPVTLKWRWWRHSQTWNSAISICQSSVLPHQSRGALIVYFWKLWSMIGTK